VDRYRKPFTDEERTELLAAFEQKRIAEQTLSDKALARKFGRTPRAIETFRFNHRHGR
jgi:hypothetical protein